MKEYNKEDFPTRAFYRKSSDVIPFITDFKDGEIVEFSHWCDRPNSYKEGLAWYYSKQTGHNLINIKNLEKIEV